MNIMFPHGIGIGFAEFTINLFRQKDRFLCYINGKQFFFTFFYTKALAALNFSESYSWMKCF